jgi:hypothetical protein
MSAVKRMRKRPAHWTRRDESDRPSQGRVKDESGASLILALIFLTVVSLVTVAVVNLAGNDLGNTSNFTGAHAVETAANNANATALQYVRYNFILQTENAFPPAPCWPTQSGQATVLAQGQSVAAWCSTRLTLGAKVTRVVTISTCLSSVSAQACVLAPRLQSIVAISDYLPKSGTDGCVAYLNPVSISITGCGSNLTVKSWVFGSQPPTVGPFDNANSTAVCSPTSKKIRITGTGFVSAPTTYVYFLRIGGASTNQAYLVSPPLSVSGGGTIIDACAPVAVSGTGNTNVVVVTASGSAIGPTY